MQAISILEQLSEAPSADPRSVPRSAPGLVALEGGRVWRGVLRGHVGPAEGDLIFTTAATGWGEILTDPSYAGQIVVLTHPMAGSYRIAASELESNRVHPRAIVCSRLVTPPAGDGVSLEQLLADARIPALTGIDTRALTLELRRGVLRRGVIRSASATDAEAVRAAGAIASWGSIDHVSRVATREPYMVGPQGARTARTTLVDFGVKRSLLAALAARGLEITVLPHDADAAGVLATSPDLIVLSPGPGDPSAMAPQIATTGALAGNAERGGPPILGVCLGHQLLALAAGAGTHRMPVGHHGGNHAVLETRTGRVDIGAHNHEVAVVDGPALAAGGYEVSHRDLNDGTVEGLTHRSGRIASVQFHPEGAPGPIDASRIFDLAVERALA
ncbi:MAG: glutamine-hydrolyzing carbamoyl-phosphate synthase small subunit [Chloroflexota bacterium]|nr:glutamine-hydrolyzing carbamoyl-phosphate synthase small subunit [Chloroflexota bacterium]